MKFCRFVEWLQEKDKGYIILIDSGNFYIAIGKDAVLLNEKLDLKLSCMCKDICKVGFPKNALEKYIKIVKRKRYSYIVYNFDRKIARLEIVDKYNGPYKNTKTVKKRDCYLCKSELDGCTKKEDKFIQAIADLRERERNEGK